MTRSHEASGGVPVLDRRGWLRWAALASATTALPLGCSRRPAPVSDATPADGPMRFPGKVPMRALNDRVPQLETPWEYFRHDLTPNEAFFVRWRLELIPTRVDLRSWRLKVAGHVERPLELSLDELRRMESASVVAVNQCSGNSRSHFSPRVPGGQWSNGAMGNDRWTGVRLSDLLRRAGLRAKAAQVSFQGLDEGPLPSVSDFVKALAVDHALTTEILVAYEMNGVPLPMINGFPVRLIVPGWYATYWVKALTTITVLPHAFTGFWMAKAYLIPNTPNGNETPEALAVNTVPINRMNIRSFFALPEAGAAPGRPAGRVKWYRLRWRQRHPPRRGLRGRRRHLDGRPPRPRPGALFLPPLAVGVDSARTRRLIDPVDCIDCEACVPECPVEAIFPQGCVPEKWHHFIQLNSERAAALKQACQGHVAEKGNSQKGPNCTKK